MVRDVQAHRQEGLAQRFDNREEEGLHDHPRILGGGQFKLIPYDSGGQITQSPPVRCVETSTLEGVSKYDPPPPRPNPSTRCTKTWAPLLICRGKLTTNSQYDNCIVLLVCTTRTQRQKSNKALH